MNLQTLDWDDELLDAIGVPRRCCPRSGHRRRSMARPARRSPGVPVASALGDQHAALVGQTCFDPGDAKCTYGTGSFFLLNTGDPPGDLAQRAADHARLQARLGGADLRAGGLDRDHGRARPVVPRQPRADRQRARDRDAGPDRRGQRRLLLRARVLGAVCAALAQRRARRDRGADRLHQQGSPRARGARGDRVADARGRGGDERRLRQPGVRAARRRRHDREQPADAVPRRRPRRARDAADRRRDRVARRRLRGRASRSASGPTPTASSETGTRPRSGCRAWTARCAARGYRKWKKAVARTVDWVDDDE